MATQQPQMGLTFEHVWAALMEDREQQRKTEESLRKLEEAHRKTEEAHRKTEEAINKMAAKVDRVSENIGGVNRSMGELIEILIAARLWEKFDAYPYNFQRAYRRVELFDDNNRKRTDVDILLTNSEYVMAVEVKRDLHRKDEVDDHLKRMELIRQFPPNQCGGKKLLGAMAGGAVDTDVCAYAYSVGLFVLELTGDSVCLVSPPEGFAPRQW
jgi:hypothetical protein